MNTQRLRNYAAATLASAFMLAGAASAMSIDPDSIKNADDCVGAEISERAYDIAFSGGGVLELDAQEIKQLVDQCEASTNTKSLVFHGMNSLKLKVGPL